MTNTKKPAPGELLEALTNGNISLAMALLERGADPNEKDGNNKTALHIAARNEEALECVKLLVEKGADIEVETIDGGHTPVRHALHGHNIPTMLFLIEKGADLEKKDKRGNNALKWATLAGPGFREIKEILEKVPLQRAEQKKIADQHDTAAARQKALAKINAKLKTGPR